MAKKTFTRWTSHTAEEAIEKLIDNAHSEVVLCDEDQLRFCKKNADNKNTWGGLIDGMCETCHEVKVTIKVEDA